MCSLGCHNLHKSSGFIKHHTLKLTATSTLPLLAMIQHSNSNTAGLISLLQQTSCLSASSSSTVSLSRSFASDLIFHRRSHLRALCKHLHQHTSSATAGEQVRHFLKPKHIYICELLAHVAANRTACSPAVCSRHCADEADNNIQLHQYNVT